MSKDKIFVLPKLAMLLVISLLSSYTIAQSSKEKIFTNGKSWRYRVTIQDSAGKTLHSEILQLNVLKGNYNGNKGIEWVHEPITTEAAILLSEKYNPLHLDIRLFEKPFTSTSSVIEKRHGAHPNIWIHPTREAFYIVLELCPFPEVYLNLNINDKWSTELANLKGFGDWDDQTVKSEYTYLGSDSINGRMKEKYSAIANSFLGTCSANFQFDRSLGFTYINYTLFDKTVLRFERITP